MNKDKKGYLILADGTILEGRRFGAERDSIGELVFTTGVEGYVESTASGYLAAVAMAAKVQGRPLPEFPKTTAIGALGQYISDESVENFQPMNINFSIIAPLEQRIRKKAEKNLAISNRALDVIQALKEAGI